MINEPSGDGAPGQARVMVSRSLVSVVDDDESVRQLLSDLLWELGFAARAIASAKEFLASDCVGQTRCLILDIAMPGMIGPACLDASSQTADANAAGSSCGGLWPTLGMTRC